MTISLLWIRLKTFFSKILEPVQNPDGSLSSRRIAGFYLIYEALDGWKKGLDVKVVLALMGMGGILLGITTLDQRNAVAAL